VLNGEAVLTGEAVCLLRRQCAHCGGDVLTGRQCAH